MIALEIALVILFFVGIGLLAGFLPAVGNTIMLGIVFPFLINWDPVILIVGYACMIQAAQFAGSASALSFNLMGELTSGPALLERHLISDRAVYTALNYTALGSVFGVLIASVFGILAFVFFDHLLWLARNPVQMSIALFFFVAVCFFPFNKSRLLNFVLLLIGILLGSVGWDIATRDTYFTFGNTYLYGGVPTLAVLFGLVTIPVLFQMQSLMKDVEERETASTDLIYPYPIGPTVRGSLIGAFWGLIPMLGHITSSLISHRVESKLDDNQTEESAIRRLVSAESANNAATLTILIPFLMFGIIMNTSEALMGDLLLGMGWYPGKMELSQIATVFGGLMVGSILCFLAVGYYIKHFNNFVRAHIKTISWVLISALVVCVIFYGNMQYSTVYYFSWLSVFILISCVVFKNVNFMPTVIGFIVHPLFWHAFIITKEIYL